MSKIALFFAFSLLTAHSSLASQGLWDRYFDLSAKSTDDSTADIELQKVEDHLDFQRATNHESDLVIAREFEKKGAFLAAQKKWIPAAIEYGKALQIAQKVMGIDAPLLDRPLRNFQRTLHMSGRKEYMAFAKVLNLYRVSLQHNTNESYETNPHGVNCIANAASEVAVFLLEASPEPAIFANKTQWALRILESSFQLLQIGTLTETYYHAALLGLLGKVYFHLGQVQKAHLAFERATHLTSTSEMDPKDAETVRETYKETFQGTNGEEIEGSPQKLKAPDPSNDLDEMRELFVKKSAQSKSPHALFIAAQRVLKGFEMQYGYESLAVLELLGMIKAALANGDEQLTNLIAARENVLKELILLRSPGYRLNQIQEAHLQLLLATNALAFGQRLLALSTADFETKETIELSNKFELIYLEGLYALRVQERELPRSSDSISTHFFLADATHFLAQVSTLRLQLEEAAMWAQKSRKYRNTGICLQALQIRKPQ